MMTRLLAVYHYVRYDLPYDLHHVGERPSGAQQCIWQYHADFAYFVLFCHISSIRVAVPNNLTDDVSPFFCHSDKTVF